MHKLFFLFLLIPMWVQAEWKKHLVVEAQRGMVNSAVAADWNSDGKNDVIASLDGKVVLLLSPDWKSHTLHEFRAGLSRNKPRTACIHSCLLDVDGDGDQDFVGSNNTVFWLECPDNPLAGPWKYRTVDDEILGTHCLITGDVNRDGKLDLIANSGRAAQQTSIPNSLVWLEVPKNPRSANKWIRHVFAKGDAPGGSHYTGFGDVNGDGLPDISCAAKGGDKFPGGQWFAWWEQSKDGKLPWKKHILADNQPGATNIMPADLNADGHVDYFATRGHGHGVLWFKGPDFNLIEIDPEILAPHSLDLADLDNDGDLDAITCSKDPVGVAAWYENNSKGLFTKHIIDRNQGSYDTRTIDMDSDGDLDVLIAGHTSNNVVWYENPLDREKTSTSARHFLGNWALEQPDGTAGWMMLSMSDGKLKGEYWAVGGGRALTDLVVEDGQLLFTRKIRAGKPEFNGGPPTGERVAVRYTARVDGDALKLAQHRHVSGGVIELVSFTGKRMPPIPPKPDLSKVSFGEPIRLFNGRNLDGWELTNLKQINGWKAVEGELVNTTEKLDFSPYSRFGNLRTEREFLDFNLKIEFKVPPGGNSGIYLRGVYEAQVLDRDSRMQGIQGVGAIFGRILPTENAGKPGGEWNRYDITLVDRHVTVVLNGKKVIDNQPIPGCTNGALHADETIPGPLYLQGDHTAVSYRNIVLTPILKKRAVSNIDWPQAAGPDGNFIVQGQAPTDFSGATGKNVKWRVPLPNTGQSAAIVSGGRIFVTSHEPIEANTEFGTGILGMCFDARTGKELWRRPIPGTRTTDLSSLFNDNTAYSPVADGKRVVFTNVGGTIKCFDYDGNELWTHTWTPFGRHHARAHEPILHEGNVILVHAATYDLPVAATTKAGSKPLGRDRKYWTHLRAYDLATGKLTWQAEPGTSVHALSMLGKLPDGRHAILTGRGGGHQPPEEPYGLSLIDAATGKSLWDAAIEKFPCHQNTTFKKSTAYYFANGRHGALDLHTGKPRGQQSIVEGVTLTRWQDGRYVTLENQTIPRGAKAKKSFTYFTNLIVGDYHYFRSFNGFLIGRVQLSTGRVEYLQVPVQVVRKKGRTDETLWTKHLPNDMKNAGGFRATQDKRNAGSGWGHVTAAPPIVVGKHIYWPTMAGTVYVLDWTAKTLNASALTALSDLGPAGETWCLSSLTYAQGCLYGRTLKELVCFGE